MTESKPRRSLRSRSVIAALLGSVIPALVGVIGTLFAVGELASRDATAILIIWTVVGYLTLTDLGLTRSAAALVAGGVDARSAARSLRPVSLTAGLVLSGALFAFLQLSGSADRGVGGLAAAAVVPLPILTTLTFPLLGGLEATGRFGLIAVHKILQSVVTYLAPPLIVAVQGLTFLGPAIAGILVYRLLAAIVLWHALRASQDIERVPEGQAPRAGQLVTWIGLSSVAGPLMLYVDRAFLGATDQQDVWWVYYVGLSELMLKSYVLPAALMSVLFPWTVRTLRSAPRQVERAYLRVIVPACITMASVAAGLVSVVPAALLARVGMPDDLVGTARVMAATFVALTLLNWSSQGLIGLLQVTGSMRWVATAQVVLVGPFVVALYIAASTESVLALVAVWGSRVFLFWCLLLYRARVDLRKLALR